MAKPSRPSDPQNSKGQIRTFFISTSTAERRPILQTDRMANLLVHDFVVMRTHLHVLLTVGDDMTIEKSVQLIKGNFSFRAKKELGITKEIWQRGFSDVRVTDEESFQSHQQYIYDNPVKAGLSTSAEECPYCSAYFKKLKRAGAKAQEK